MVHRRHIVFALLTFVALVTHIWQLSSIPRGLYSDEAAIGYNAWLISTTGIDEHDRTFPLFFESFGDYKSPVYMYTAVVTTALLGPGEWAVRLAATLFWLVFAIATGALIAAMFPRNQLVLLATIVSASF